jgi:small-conductance mechanosensitive channel
MRDEFDEVMGAFEATVADGYDVALLVGYHADMIENPGVAEARFRNRLSARGRTQRFAFVADREWRTLFEDVAGFIGFDARTSAMRRLPGFWRHRFLRSSMMRAEVRVAAAHDRPARWTALVLCLLMGLWTAGPAAAQEQEDEDAAPAAAAVETAPVVIDGETFFEVRGASSFTAEERAEGIVNRIANVADSDLDGSAKVVVRPSEFGPAIYADGAYIIVVTEADAELEGLTPDLIADLLAEEIAKAITLHREGRSEAGVQRSILFALGWSAAFVVFILSLFGLKRFLRGRTEARLQRLLTNLDRDSGRIVDASALFAAQRLFFRGVIIVIIIAASYYYIARVLREFAYTSTFASVLLDTLAAPIIALGTAALMAIPDLLTLVVIILIARYLLKLLRLFFLNIEDGVIVLKDFEPGWVWPTHRLARAILIIVAVVVAYPHIPGSDTAAFKGMTILLGVLMSIGSNSVASNLLAGLVVVYKRSINIGDRIRVGDVIGDVERVSLLDTQVRSLKNEMVSLPNSTLLNSQVTNFTRTGQTPGLLIHTTVGIGYDEPRSEVERLLVEAARETPGLKTDPTPFVLRTELASHDIKYQLNAYRVEGSDPERTRSDLHACIIDRFHQEGVQIMTPFYVGYPEEPKIPQSDAGAPAGSGSARAKRA